eukprot:COSAG01_NODE_264_length_19971_cov_62.193923_18_plen_34_part_00
MVVVGMWHVGLMPDGVESTFVSVRRSILPVEIG